MQFQHVFEHVWKYLGTISKIQIRRESIDDATCTMKSPWCGFHVLLKFPYSPSKQSTLKQLQCSNRMCCVDL